MRLPWTVSLHIGHPWQALSKWVLLFFLNFSFVFGLKIMFGLFCTLLCGLRRVNLGLNESLGETKMWIFWGWISEEGKGFSLNNRYEGEVNNQSKKEL